MVRKTVIRSECLQKERETTCSCTAKDRTNDEDPVSIRKVISYIFEFFSVGKLIQNYTTNVWITLKTDNHVRLQILVRIKHLEHCL